MDQKLLQALNNVGFALESLTEAIQSNQEAKSSTAEAIKSGNFGKQLESITVELKSIKSDTQQILKNQETIISLSKEKEKEKTQTVEDAGSKEQQSAIKKGVGTILLIAGAVLAIGLAFKIVGKVDFLSVISLSLAITILAVAFEKIAQMKDLTLKTAAIASASLLMMSIALALSSIALSYIKPVSPAQILTGILIGGMFAIVSFSVEKMMSAFKGRSLKEIGFSALFLPLILTSISIAIALSSYALSYVQPIGLAQFFTATLIAVTFVVLSYGIRGLMRAFKGMGLKSVAMAAIFLPIILPAISLAIAGASYALQLVQPIGLAQFFTALMIGVIFMVLSFGLKQIIKSFKGIDPATAVVAAFMIPILFTAMSAAIWASSELLSNVVPISLSQFLTSIAIGLTFVVLAYALSPIIKVANKMNWTTLIKLPLLFTVMSVAIMASSHILSLMAPLSTQQMIQAAILGGTLGIIALIMTPSIKILGKLGIGELLKGSLAIVILAGIIMVTSHILAIGDYDVYPGIGWIAGVALSLTAFGIAAFALGALVFGPQALIFLAGLGAVLGLAGTIVGVSKILSAGQYDNPGMLEWAKATSLLYATFTPILLILGTAALASAVVSIFGPDPWKMAQDAILDVANTIVQVSYILQEGNYSEGPTKEWAEGIAIALGAFSPVYGMLMKNAIFSLFGGGGVGPDEFTEAILTVSDGIITAANKFANANAAFNNPPPVEWADGVGKAISAFSPVYKVLAEQDGWFVDGPSVEDMKNAIITISEGIVEAAKYFAENSAPFEEGKYPSAKWGEGVGAALNAFAPVFKALSEDTGWFTSGDDVIGNMGKGIRAITKSLVESAIIFSLFNGAFGVYPDEEWGKGVGASLNAFAPVFKSLSEDTGWFTSGDDVIQDMAKGVRVLSYSLVDAAKAFSSAEGIWGAYPNESWAKGVSLSINSYMDLFAELEERGYTTLSFSVNSKVLEIGIDSMVSVASMLFNNKDYFTVQLDNNFIANIATNVLGFAKLGLELDNMLVSEKTITTENSGFMGIGASKKEETVRVTKDMGIVEKVTANLINVAKMLFFNKEFFTETDNYSKFYTDIVSMSSGIIWRFTKLANRLNANEDLSFWNVRKTAYNLVKTAKTLFLNKEFFTETDNYSKFYSDIVSIESGILVKFTNLANHLNLQEGLSFWSVRQTASNLVRTAKILHGGQEYFGLEVDPNYMKNVSQNIIDFNNLVKQLVESESDKGFLEKIGDATDSLLGTDPISQIARRMITLAEGYDALASSLTKLGIAMKTLNITDVRMLGGLTRTLSAPSGDVNVGGNKGKENNFVSKKTTTSVNTSTAGTTFGSKIGGDVTISDKLDEVIKLLSNIDKSTGSVDSLIGQYLGDEDAPSSAPNA